MEDIQLDISWDDVACPICLDFPHNSVLLHCSSYDKGCRAFVCDTNQLHSNCLDRFKNSCGMPSSPVSNATSTETTENSDDHEVSNGQCNLTCPLCRGEVSGWVIVDKARIHLDEKKRCCDEVRCTFMGSYLELQEHAQLEHPHARPSKIDPARQLDWENFQQSSEIIDVLSTIHSEIPRGVVLGDYVIEYGDDDARDEFEDFPGDEGNWWTSCILYFDNFRRSRNRRTRVSRTGRDNRRLSYDTSNSDEGSVVSMEYADYRIEEIDDDFVSTSGSSRGSSGYRRLLLLLYFLDPIDAVPAFMTIRIRKQNLFNVMGSMYNAILFLGIQNGFSVQPVVAIERTVFYRERTGGMYLAILYVVAQVTSQFGDVTSEVELNETVKEFLRRYFGYRDDFVGVPAGVVVGLAVLFVTIFAFSVKVFMIVDHGLV
ncbi:hypothetical protein JHK82_039706 [Glycine max]|nr:hypothetical protein JHK86_039900 [Glycine max]KAG4965505.1 hypothetical protein JHK85_040480 [Glycine max]KAG5110483.1 hypothetical protein JHK82_039706 [Glycine max]